MIKRAETPMRLAGFLLVLLGITHGIGFMLAATDPGGMSFGARAIYEAMRAYDIQSNLGATRWTSFVLFSLSHSFMMVFAGLATMMVAETRDQALKRRFSFVSLVFWVAAVALWATFAPLEGAGLIGVVTIPFYFLSWRRLR